jgi:hypothetical protein
MSKIHPLTNVEKRVLGFLVAKGLLVAPHVTPMSSLKLRISDAINVGLTSEPRVLEVLPAALLHFPRSFLGYEEMPEKLKETLSCIRLGKPSGPSLGGIPYSAMLRWANEPLLDKRTRPERERKVTKAFRLKRSTLEKLSLSAARAQMTETAFLEKLLVDLEISK